MFCQIHTVLYEIWSSVYRKILNHILGEVGKTLCSLVGIYPVCKETSCLHAKHMRVYPMTDVPGSPETSVQSYQKYTASHPTRLKSTTHGKVYALLVGCESWELKATVVDDWTSRPIQVWINRQEDNKTGNVCMNANLKRFRLTIFAVEKQ
jgi:hypothetical protein